MRARGGSGKGLQRLRPGAAPPGSARISGSKRGGKGALLQSHRAHQPTRPRQQQQQQQWQDNPMARR
jgi:hypothetical protein